MLPYSGFRVGSQKCLAMSDQIKKNQPPDEKKNQPLGKSVPLTINGSNSFVVQLNDGNSHSSLTTVSSIRKTSLLLGREQEDQRSVASKADSSNTAWIIKIFLN